MSNKYKYNFKNILHHKYENFKFQKFYEKL